MPSRSHKALLVAALLGPALMFAAMGWWSWERIERDTADRIERTTDLLHQHAAKLLQSERLTLARIADRVAGMDRAEVARREPELHAFLKGVLAELEEGDSAVIADSDGELEAMSRGYPVPARLQPAPTPANVHDRPYFRALQTGAAIAIDGPFRGRMSGRPIFTIARRLEQPGGGFRGAAVLVASPRYLSQFWSALVDAGDTVSLVRDDGVVLARFPEVAGNPETQPARFSDFTMQRLRAVERGQFETPPSPIDGVVRILGHRKIAGLPVHIGYAVDRGNVLEEWYQTLLPFAAVALAATAGLLLSAFAVIRRAHGESSALARAEAAAAALSASEAQHRALYDKTPAPMQACDAEARLVAVSERWLELLGYRRDEVIGRPLVDFMAPASARIFTETGWRRVLEHGESRDLERQYVRKNGEVLDVLVSARVERDADGGFVRCFGVLIDVTQQKRMAAALRQAQKMEAVGQMTGGVAHDFNNLLTVVVGNLELIADSPGNGEQVRKRAEAALRAAERGSALTQQLLAFARRQMLRPETVNPNQILKEFTPLIQQAAGEAVEVQTILSPGLEPCLLDRAQFEAAVLNLVVNARDAMPQGGRITIETRNLDILVEDAEALPPIPPGAYALVTLSDTGEGMPDAILERVFEPFFTTKEVGRGSGLGLSMVYGFVSQSGGHVRIDSEVSVGTTVRLYLPRSAERAPAPAHRRPGAARSAPGSETILLVEDNAEVREVGAGMLRELGYEVVVARDAAEALVLLRSARPVHALFSDVIMPGMTGDQLAQEARSLRPGIKVLLTSGFAAQLAAEGGQLRGFPVIPKPYRRADLAARLRALLES